MVKIYEAEGGVFTEFFSRSPARRVLWANCETCNTIKYSPVIFKSTTSPLN